MAITKIIYTPQAVPKSRATQATAQVSTSTIIQSTELFTEVFGRLPTRAEVKAMSQGVGLLGLVANRKVTNKKKLLASAQRELVRVRGGGTSGAGGGTGSVGVFGDTLQNWITQETARQQRTRVESTARLVKYGILDLNNPDAQPSTYNRINPANWYISNLTSPTSGSVKLHQWELPELTYWAGKWRLNRLSFPGIYWYELWCLLCDYGMCVFDLASGNPSGVTGSVPDMTDHVFDHTRMIEYEQRVKLLKAIMQKRRTTEAMNGAGAGAGAGAGLDSNSIQSRKFIACPAGQLNATLDAMLQTVRLEISHPDDLFPHDPELAQPKIVLKGRELLQQAMALTAWKIPIIAKYIEAEGVLSNPHNAALFPELRDGNGEWRLPTSDEIALFANLPIGELMGGVMQALYDYGSIPAEIAVKVAMSQVVQATIGSAMIPGKAGAADRELLMKASGLVKTPGGVNVNVDNRKVKTNVLMVGAEQGMPDWPEYKPPQKVVEGGNIQHQQHQLTPGVHNVNVVEELGITAKIVEAELVG